MILAVLLIGGFFRSLQFTSINTLGYADIDRQRMSRATSFASMVQQLSLSVGVGTGALLLHLTMAARGGTVARDRRLRPGLRHGRHLRGALGPGLRAACRRTPGRRSAAMVATRAPGAAVRQDR